MTDLPYADTTIELGSRKIVGQLPVRNRLVKTLQSGRLSHAYMFAGPKGIGKTALALAFAEAINGIDNISDLSGTAFSKKSSWINHPDIHLFMPIPGSINPEIDELNARTKLLAEDPYEIVDFANRPAIVSSSESKNRNAFYSVNYFGNYIRPACYLKPSEGFRKVVIITEIDTMRKEVSNAFLKLLEEPPPRVMFLLTTSSINSLLPTILSRCQVMHCNPLSDSDIEQALIQKDNFSPDDARYLSKVAAGNYAITRFFNVERLQNDREDIVRFLRFSYQQHAGEILKLINKWSKEHNKEGIVSLINMLEIFIRDISLYRDTGSETFITNIDKIDTIKRFVDSLKNARLDEMLAQCDPMRSMIQQNINVRMALLVLALRFGRLMRNYDTVIAPGDDWKHLPAFEFN